MDKKGVNWNGVETNERNLESKKPIDHNWPVTSDFISLNHRPVIVNNRNVDDNNSITWLSIVYLLTTITKALDEHK